MRPANFPRRIEARRDSAASRQAAYDALSHAEKVAKAVPGSNEALKLGASAKGAKVDVESDESVTTELDEAAAAIGTPGAAPKRRRSRAKKS